MACIAQRSKKTASFFIDVTRCRAEETEDRSTLSIVNQRTVVLVSETDFSFRTSLKFIIFTSRRQKVRSEQQHSYSDT